MVTSRVMVCRWRSPGEPTCSVKSYGYTPRYVAKLRYREVNSPEGRWIDMELRLALEHIDKTFAEAESRIRGFLELLREERLDWVEVLISFMDTVTALAPPYTTPGAEVRVMDTGGDYPVTDIQAVYIG